jgi:hypothetical protein
MIIRQPDSSRMDRIKKYTKSFDLGSISRNHGVPAEIPLFGKK